MDIDNLSDMDLVADQEIYEGFTKRGLKYYEQIKILPLNTRY